MRRVMMLVIVILAIAGLAFYPAEDISYPDYIALEQAPVVEFVDLTTATSFEWIELEKVRVETEPLDDKGRIDFGDEYWEAIDWMEAQPWHQLPPSEELTYTTP